jgi:DNA-binding helix-hairpin-helix protein with protein kinase domain
MTGARLFGHKIRSAPLGGTATVSALWESIIAIPPPPIPEPAIPLNTWVPPQQEKTIVAERMVRRWSSIIVTLVSGAGVFITPVDLVLIASIFGFFIAFLTWPKLSTQERRALKTALERAKSDWDGLAARWNTEASTEQFTKLFTDLESVRRQILELPGERARRMSALTAAQQKVQREKYLDRQRIDQAGLEGIWQSRISMLSAFGVETALDVDASRIRAIPGFGEVLTGRLVEWRRKLEQAFKFNPNEPIDSAETAKIEQELSAKQATWTQRLQSGGALLSQSRLGIITSREQLRPLLNQAWSELRLAEYRKKNF